jgi:hypothetical protein
MIISGVDVTSGVVDLEFRVNILEKIVQRLLSNSAVAGTFTPKEIQDLWLETFAELRVRYPNFNMELKEPPTSLIERGQTVRIGWTCPQCNWAGVKVVTFRPLAPGENPEQAATITCPQCNRTSLTDVPGPAARQHMVSITAEALPPLGPPPIPR